MKNEKVLTTQQLSLYLGCECMVGAKKGRLVAIDVYRTPSVSFPHESGNEVRQFITPDKIQPILIPLSELTLGQAKAIADKHEYDEKHVFKFVDTDTDFKSEEDFRTAVWILNELRALGYDCDDLIEQKLAIDKTKL